jgi:hypothetical protein
MRGLFASYAKRLSSDRTITLPWIDPSQERLGGRIALTAAIRISGQVLTTYNLHLESKENDALRVSQLKRSTGWRSVLVIEINQRSLPVTGIFNAENRGGHSAP